MSNMTRRQFVAAALATTTLAGCSTMSKEQEASQTQGASESATAATAQETENSDEGSNEGSTSAKSGKVLLAYFSRAGENYANGGVAVTEVGNTKVMAGFIKDALACDEFEIVPAEEYPYSYDETLTIAKDEQSSDARPAISGSLPSLADYDTILLGCPVWWGQPPMIINTFLEGLASQAVGKTVFPFSTHGGSGLGHLDSTIAAAWPDATVSSNSLAATGATISNAREQVEDWANGLGPA